MRQPLGTRFVVRTNESPFRTIRNPYRVIDTKTNTIVDEYASEKAARHDASERNRETPKETP